MTDIPVDVLDSELWPEGWDADPAAVEQITQQVTAARHARDYLFLLAEETVRQRARRAAKRLVDAEERADEDFEIPEPTQLTVLLGEEDEVEDWRIKDVWPRGGNILLTAGAKAGKTTTTGNIVRCLVDGDRFLKVFPVDPIAECERVAIIDFEMPRKSVKKWLRQQAIRNTDSVVIWTERGKAAKFDLREQEIRAKWVARLVEKNSKVWMIDCLSPVLSALGINENDNTEVGRFLDGLTAAAVEADVDEIFLVHHMGHAGERARGASRLIGWPDVNWRLVRKKDEKDPNADTDPDAPRYFQAYGRDVDVREGRLIYDESNRHLTYVEGGRKSTEQSQALYRLLVHVRDNPDEAKDAIEKAMKGQGIGRNDARKAMGEAVTKAYVSAWPGKAGALRHAITAEGRRGLRMLSANPLDDDELAEEPVEETFCACGIYIEPAAVREGLDQCKFCRGDA